MVPKSQLKLSIQNVVFILCYSSPLHYYALGLKFIFIFNVTYFNFCKNFLKDIWNDYFSQDLVLDSIERPWDKGTRCSY